MAVTATGFFDGVHTGHRAVIGRLVREASARGEDSVVVTFNPHPRAVLQKGAPQLRLLTSHQEKCELLLSLGVTRVETLPFTREFAKMTADSYIRELLAGRFGASALVFGYDNRIGSDGAGIAEVSSIVSALGIDLVKCDAVGDISSTKIRHCLENGDVDRANEMLGYDYFLNGVVVEGQKIGRTLGFPTANLQVFEPLKLIPANGVYLVKVELPALYSDSRALYGMCNIGSRPTVNTGSDITIETNIFDFDEQIYGLPMKISILKRLRGETRFSSTATLRDQLQSDLSACWALLSL